MLRIPAPKTATTSPKRRARTTPVTRYDHDPPAGRAAPHVHDRTHFQDDGVDPGERAYERHDPEDPRTQGEVLRPDPVAVRGQASRGRFLDEHLRKEPRQGGMEGEPGEDQQGIDERQERAQRRDAAYERDPEEGDKETLERAGSLRDVPEGPGREAEDGHQAFPEAGSEGRTRRVWTAPLRAGSGSRKREVTNPWRSKVARVRRSVEGRDAVRPGLWPDGVGRVRGDSRRDGHHPAGWDPSRRPPSAGCAGRRPAFQAVGAVGRRSGPPRLLRPGRCGPP